MTSRKAARPLVRNFYETLPEEYKPKPRPYKNQHLINIDLEFRAIICGKTSSGKNNLLCAILQNMACWNRIFVLCKTPDEPLYKWLQDCFHKIEKKHKTHIFTITTDIDDIPSAHEFSKEDSNLVIADDQMLEAPANMKKIQEMFVFGRKHSISSIFISQGFLADCIPQAIRKNTDYIFLTKVQSVKDLKRMFNEWNIGCEWDEFKKLYNQSQQSYTSFVLIDLSTRRDDLRFRVGFEPNFPKATSI